MPTLLLIRHGENDFSARRRLAGRLPGVHLNERGIQQAAALAEALASTRLRAVYSSPLERAVETAQPIAVSHRLRVQIVPGLMEADVGAWEGKYLSRLSRGRAWKAIQHSPSRSGHPGGESFLQIQERVTTALDSVCRKHGRRDMIACVMHADPIKLAVAHYIGLPLDKFQRLACGTGSVTILYVGESSASLLQLSARPPFQLDGRRG